MTAPLRSPVAPAAERYGLTPRMFECFKAIEQYIAINQHSPSYTELRNAMGLKTKGRIHEYLMALQARGWITFKPRLQRSIAIVPGAGDYCGYVLPSRVEAALRAHCNETGENPTDVVADAVALFVDEAEGSVAA